MVTIRNAHISYDDFCAQKYPPQPMMDQIRTLLDDYSKCGGKYREVSVEGSGHVPFISHQDDFNRVFHAFLGTGAMSGFGNGA